MLFLQISDLPFSGSLIFGFCVLPMVVWANKRQTNIQRPVQCDEILQGPKMCSAVKIILFFACPFLWPCWYQRTRPASRLPEYETHIHGPAADVKTYTPTDWFPTSRDKSRSPYLGTLVATAESRQINDNFPGRKTRSATSKLTTNNKQYCWGCSLPLVAIDNRS